LAPHRDKLLPPGIVQELVPNLFAALEGRTVPVVALLIGFDVQDFERERDSAG